MKPLHTVDYFCQRCEKLFGNYISIRQHLKDEHGASDSAKGENRSVMFMDGDIYTNVSEWTFNFDVGEVKVTVTASGPNEGPCSPWRDEKGELTNGT